MADRKKALPKPFPNLPQDRERLLTWASKATLHEVVDTYRAGAHENAALVVTLAGGRELFFETVADACRPDRFISAFLSIDGVPMEEWSRPQVKCIVGALVRASRLGKERDERETFTDLGARFLRACLTDGNVIDERKMATPEGAYRGAVALALATKHLTGGDGERFPNLLYAVDEKAMYAIRGLFLPYTRRVVGRMNTATLNAHMRRVGWASVDVQPRKPGAPKAARPHLRCWRVEDGFDGIRGTQRAPAADDDRGPVAPRGPGSSARAGGRGRTSSARGHAGPRFHGEWS